MRSIKPRLLKHVPQRTCLACREVKAKRSLIRLVRAPDGRVEVANGGKKMGRGAYLCPKEECWEIGLKGNRLEYSLRVRLTQENREQLVRFGGDLLKGAGSGKGR